jgi:hypothetical protein
MHLDIHCLQTGARNATPHESLYSRLSLSIAPVTHTRDAGKSTAVMNNNKKLFNSFNKQRVFLKSRL